jgi:ribosomal protein S18 acetylase RimI-like enzyme
MYGMSQNVPKPPGSILMRRDLREAIEEGVWPVGTQLREFTPESAGAVHEVLTHAYVDESGFVDAFPAWWAALKADAEFDPKLVFVARDEAFQVVGVALCWTSAFIKDLAVRRDWRRRGLGRALLLHAFAVFQQRGATEVRLKVHADNPSGAIRVYRSVGMRDEEEFGVRSSECGSE